MSVRSISKAYRAGVKFILESQKEDGGWPPFLDDISDAWTTAEAIQVCLTVPQASKKNLARGVNWLVENQLNDDGWSSAAYGKSLTSDVPTTAYVLIAMQNYTVETGHVRAFGPYIEQAARWLLGKQQSGGGWSPLGVPEEQRRPHIGCTAFALRGLAYAPRSIEAAEALQNGLDFLHQSMTEEVGWAFAPGQSPDVTLTCYVLRALIDIEALQGHSITRDIYRKWIDRIFVDQRANGSWSDWQGILSSPEATAYVLEIISSLIRKPLAYPKLNKPVGFLLSHQNKDGSWPKDPNDPKSCVWVTHNVILALYSLYCRQLNKLQRICKYIEFKKEWPKQFKYEIAVEPGQNTLEIGIEENKPYLLVNQERPKKRFEEWLFAPLVLIAAARKKSKKVNKITDLLFPQWPKKEQLLTEIRQFLMTASFKTDFDTGDILPSDGSGNVELKVFEKNFITVDRSICRFESQHMLPAEQEADEILRLLKVIREQDFGHQVDNETDSFWANLAARRKRKLKASYRRLKHEARLTFKHTRIVMKAVEIMGWKFQNKNWRKRWVDLVTKCRLLFENLKHLDDEKDTEEELYFPNGVASEAGFQ